MVSVVGTEVKRHIFKVLIFNQIECIKPIIIYIARCSRQSSRVTTAEVPPTHPSPCHMHILRPLEVLHPSHIPSPLSLHLVLRSPTTPHSTSLLYPLLTTFPISIRSKPTLYIPPFYLSLYFHFQSTLSSSSLILPSIHVTLLYMQSFSYPYFHSPQPQCPSHSCFSLLLLRLLTFFCSASLSCPPHLKGHHFYTHTCHQLW